MVQCLVAVLLLGAGAVPPPDAFLSRREVRPLVDVRELPAPTRERVTAGRVSSTEPRLGVPTFFWAARAPKGQRTLRAVGLTAAEAARRHLVAHAELYRGEPGRWAEAQVAKVHELADGGAVLVSFQQRVGGVRLFRDELRVIMTSEYELVALSGYLTPALRRLGDFALSPEAALASAWAAMTHQGLGPERVTALGPAPGGYLRYALAGEETPARVRQVYFPLPEGLVPAFYVELEHAGDLASPAVFSWVVSAVDGAVLYGKDLTARDGFTYRVWADPAAPHLPAEGPQPTVATPHPTGAPDGFDPGAAPQALVTLAHGPLSTGDPWLAPGSTETRGNNVFAYADIARSNGFTTGSDVMGVTTADATFDHLYDFQLEPDATLTQRRAAVVQLFFDNNFFHDWYYDVGFDEAAGNAQANNLGRGGLPNDVLRAEAQDFSGRNNANMSTPSDGASPRMQMFVFDGVGQLSLTASGAVSQAFSPLNDASFGAGDFSLTGDLAVAEPGQACSALTNAVAGKVVLIDRGTCEFQAKVMNAQAAGAVGVIIANSANGQGAPYLAGTNPAITIPAISVTAAAGTQLKAGLQTGAVSVTMTRTRVLDRDGTVDNAIVAHEWGHYISNRLIGDGNGLSNLQGVGMGEGWADFHSMLLIVRAEDLQVPANADWTGVYGMAGWTSFAQDPNGYYFGIRRVPYSTDLTKNGLTFKHVQDGVRLPSGVPTAFGQSGADNSEVHATGEVWATMLWECYAALLRDGARYTFDEARDRMRAYLVAGYKGTPDMPTFVEARDALLAAAAARDLQDFALFWAAFARRGLGMLAEAPDRDALHNAPAVESFLVGNLVAIGTVTLDDVTHSCDHDGVLDANEAGFVSVTVRNVGSGTLSATTVSVSTNAPGVTFPMGTVASVPALAPFGSATVKLPVAYGNLAGVQGVQLTVTAADPSLAVSQPVSEAAMFRVNYDLQAAAATADDVEAPMAQWTATSDPSGNTGSDFRIFQASATARWWFGPNPKSAADTWLVSPRLEVGTEPLLVTFKHRFDFERDSTENYDGAVVELSIDDGATWSDVGAQASPGYTGLLTTSQNQSANPLRGRRAWVGRSAGYPTFHEEAVDLGTRYAGQTVRLRFRIGADEAAGAKGWEIDDIAFSGLSSRPFHAVVTDPNTCTNVVPTASVGPAMEVAEGAPVTLVGAGMDTDGDAVQLAWTQVAGPAVALFGGDFTAPFVAADTVLRFELTVTDGRVVTAPLPLEVLVRDVNRGPTVTASGPALVSFGDVVTATAVGVDPDGEALSWEWTQVEGPPVVLEGADTATVRYVAPAAAVEGAITLEVVARDRELASAPAAVRTRVRYRLATGSLAPSLPASSCSVGAQGGLAPLAALLLALRARRRRWVGRARLERPRG